MQLSKDRQFLARCTSGPLLFPELIPIRKVGIEWREGHRQQKGRDAEKKCRVELANECGEVHYGVFPFGSSFI